MLNLNRQNLLRLNILACLLFLMAFIPRGASELRETVTVSYNESDEIFINPERGFYTYSESTPGESPMSVSEFREIRDNGQSLIIRLYNIDEFRESDISQEYLEKIETEYEAMRQAGIKAIIRFRYTRSMEGEDAPLEWVLAHIDQLKPVFERNYDVIATVHGGFIGAWGEWHASSNNLTTTENMRAILLHLIDAIPERAVGIRYPEAKMRIFDTQDPLGPDEAFDGSHRSRAAHLNDCFLASPIDVGTYRIDPEWEKEYLSDENRYMPMGGETCNPRPDAGDRYHCETALAELDKMHWSYLNANYSRRILDVWEEQGCMPDVERRLGYRFVLEAGSFGDQATPGGTFDFNLTLHNRGFASPYNPRGLQVVLRDANNPDAVWFVDLPDDPRFWLGGETVQLAYNLDIPEDLPSGTYNLLLNLPDPEERLYGVPEFSIRLANSGLWEAETGYNRLNHQISIQ